MSAVFRFSSPEMDSIIIGVIGLIAAGLALFIGRRFLGQISESSDETSADLSLPKITLPSERERRNTPRRQGSSVKAFLADDSDLAPTEVWVANRSLGGLCLLSEAPVEVGSQLRVRPYNSTNSLPWTPVRVCSCHQERDGWMIHCQFNHLPPTNVLLLFG